MKTRNGFVSNSSSSSFIIRGIKITKDDLKNILSIEEDEDGYMKTWDKQRELSQKSNEFDVNIESTRDYFDGEETDEFVIGDRYTSLEDGCVTEIETYEKDEELISFLSELGFGTVEELKEKLKTYAQYISNDNY